MSRFVELDRLDSQRSGPAGLVVERVLERRLGVLLAEEEVDRFRVAEFYERIGAHTQEPKAWFRVFQGD
jgi:hypothetical protein